MSSATKTVASFSQLLARNGVLGLSVLVGSALSFGKAKVISVYGGPADLAVFGVFTGLIAFAAAASMIGLTSSAVQKIAQTDAAEIELRRTIFRDAARIGLLGAVAVSAFILGSWLVGSTALGTRVTSSRQVLVLVVALLAAVVSEMLLVWFRSLQDINRIALHAAGGALLSFGITFGYYALGYPLGPEVAAASLGVGGALTAIVLGHRAMLSVVAGLFDRFRHAKDLLVFGGTVYVSRLFDTARSFATPLLLSIILTTESAGFVQAASRLSLALVGLLLAGAAKEFYPRVAAIAAHDDLVRRTIDRQLVFLVMLYLPVAAVSVLLTDLIIVTLFSEAFAPATPLFQLHVLGDLPRIAAWILGFTCLGAGGSRYYAMTEIITHSVFMAILVGMTFAVGLYSEPIAYIVAGLLQLVMYAVWVRRRYQYRPGAMAVAACVLYVGVWTAILAGRFMVGPG